MFGTFGWPVGAASLSLILVAVGMARLSGLQITREIVIASVRAAVQLLVVGVLFTAIFASTAAPIWASAWVVGMVVVGSAVVVRRARRPIDGLALVVGSAVVGSTLVSVAVVFGFGVITLEPVSLVVVSGITIGNAVPLAVLGVNQSIDLARDRVGELEAVLAFGFGRRAVVRFMAPRVAEAALTPQIERTKMVGLIALPGAMTGLLLAGVEPLDAVMIQLIVMYLVLGSAAVCVVSVVTLVTRASVSSDLRVAAWVRPDG